VQNTNNNLYDQEWSLVDAGGGYCEIVNRNSGYVLSIPNATTASATQLIQYHYDGGAYSQWSFISAGNGSYKIVSHYDGQCVDDNQFSTNDNGSIIQYSDNGGKNQQWQLVSVP
jgi:hypothetical protein